MTTAGVGVHYSGKGGDTHGRGVLGRWKEAGGGGGFTMKE